MQAAQKQAGSVNADGAVQCQMETVPTRPHDLQLQSLFSRSLITTYPDLARDAAGNIQNES